MTSLSQRVAALSFGFAIVAAPLVAQGSTTKPAAAPAKSTSSAASPLRFSLGGGVGIPLGDFDDAAKLGWHGQAAVAYAPATLPVSFQVDGNFGQFSTEVDGVKDRMMYATGNVVYNFKTAESSRLHPYLIGGLGFYNQKATGDAVPDGVESTTDLGINAGAGFNVAAGSASLFVEGRFHDVFTDGSSTQFVPLTVGVRFGGK